MDGGLFLCFEADAAAVTITGEVTRYRSSAFAKRAFCPRCGAHLWFNDVQEGGEPKSYELMPGLFDAARLAASIRDLRGPCHGVGASPGRTSPQEPGRIRGRESVRRGRHGVTMTRLSPEI